MNKIKNQKVSKIAHKTNLHEIIGHVSKFVKTWYRDALGFNRVWGTSIVDDYLKRLLSWSHHHGEAYAVSRNKSIRLSVTRYLSGEPIIHKGIRSTKDGIPVELGDMIPMLRKRQNLREILTLLAITRAVKSKKSLPVYDEICHEWKGTLPPNIDRSIQNFFRREIRFGKVRTDFEEFHFSTKSGPNGHSMKMCHADLVLLPDSLVHSIGVLAGTKLRDRMLLLRSFLNANPDFLSDVFPRKGKDSFRSIVSIPDSELKNRTVAMADYYSQTALKPFSKELYRILKKIPQDCTFDQSSFIGKLPKGEKYFSFDLHAASDRVPLVLIERIMSKLIGKTKASAWADIMSGYEFTCPDGIPRRYTTGQPMGMYSSWPAFTLAHHFIIYLVAQKVQVPFRKLPYAILGDDIVIAGEKAAQAYLEFCRTLDIPISLQKTHSSKDVYEFAKRWFFKGTEITPFPTSGFIEMSKRYFTLTQFLYAERKKGFLVSQEIPSVVGCWYRIRYKSRRFASKFIVKSLQLVSLFRAFDDYTTGTTAINILLDCLNRPRISTSVIRDVGTAMISNVAVEMFSESSGGGYSDLPVRAICELTTPGFVTENNNVERLIDSLPLLGIQGWIERSYMELKAKARRIDTLEQGQWPLLFRAMTVPDIDRVFSARTWVTRSMAVAKIVHKIMYTLDIIQEYGLV